MRRGLHDVAVLDVTRGSTAGFSTVRRVRPQVVSQTDSVTRADNAEAAAMLRRLLAAVDAGELEANGGRATALVRRMEGAAVAFELAAGIKQPGPDESLLG